MALIRPATNSRVAAPEDRGGRAALVAARHDGPRARRLWEHHRYASSSARGANSPIERAFPGILTTCCLFLCIMHLIWLRPWRLTPIGSVLYLMGGKCRGCRTITRELATSAYFSACWPQVTRVSTCVDDRPTPPTKAFGLICAKT